MPNKTKTYKNSGPKVYIKTFGCQMNIRDSEVISGLMKREGYQIVANESDADVLIYNTCSVRQHAEDRVWSEIGKYSTRKPANSLTRKPIIGLVGCMAQNYKDEVFRRTPQVDFVVGPSDIHKIPEVIKRIAHSQNLLERKIWQTGGEIRPEKIYHTGFREDKNHGFVVISEGCSNLCSYCVVPYVRGPLKNRDYKNIINEIEEAVAQGIDSITLLGQNVNAYRLQATSLRPQVDFVELLRLVNAIKGLKEFSFITSHPKDTTVELFKAMQECDKLRKCLHLPVQSGSDRILELMNRGYTRKYYLDLIKEYRRIVDEGILTTDFIVGFPSETEEEFKQTYNLAEEVEFDSAYIFKYSARPHTQAESFADDVPIKEKQKRHQLILTLQRNISKRKQSQCIKAK